MEIYDGFGCDLTPTKPVEVTLTTSQGNFLVNGIQLRERKFVPKQLGRLVLWLFFHRTDSATQITLTGFVNPLPTASVKKTGELTVSQIRILIGLGLFLAGIVLMRFAHSL